MFRSPQPFEPQVIQPRFVWLWWNHARRLKWEERRRGSKQRFRKSYRGKQYFVILCHNLCIVALRCGTRSQYRVHDSDLYSRFCASWLSKQVEGEPCSHHLASCPVHVLIYFLSSNWHHETSSWTCFQQIQKESKRYKKHVEEAVSSACGFRLLDFRSYRELWDWVELAQSRLSRSQSDFLQEDKYMGVSINGGYPKMDGFNGKSYWNGWFGGTMGYPYFRKPTNIFPHNKAVFRHACLPREVGRRICQPVGR